MTKDRVMAFDNKTGIFRMVSGEVEYSDSANAMSKKRDRDLLNNIDRVLTTSEPDSIKPEFEVARRRGFRKPLFEYHYDAPALGPSKSNVSKRRSMISHATSVPVAERVNFKATILRSKIDNSGSDFHSSLHRTASLDRAGSHAARLLNEEQTYPRRLTHSRTNYEDEDLLADDDYSRPIRRVSRQQILNSLDTSSDIPYPELQAIKSRRYMDQYVDSYYNRDPEPEVMFRYLRRRLADFKAANETIGRPHLGVSQAEQLYRSAPHGFADSPISPRELSPVPARPRERAEALRQFTEDDVEALRCELDDTARHYRHGTGRSLSQFDLGGLPGTGGHAATITTLPLAKPKVKDARELAIFLQEQKKYDSRRHDDRVENEKKFFHSIKGQLSRIKADIGNDRSSTSELKTHIKRLLQRPK